MDNFAPSLREAPSPSEHEEGNSMLEKYIRERCRLLGLTLAELCREAGISRQTLYDCWAVDKYPSTATLVALSWVLKIHPLRLQELVFSEVMLPSESTDYTPGDRSAFVEDKTYADGEPVLAEIGRAHV